MLQLPYPMKRLTTPYRIAIAVIIVAGLLFRLWAAWHQPVFLDEAHSITEAKFYSFSGFDRSYPPLYVLLLKGMTFFSTRLFWMRLPSVFAGTVSIILLWHVTSRYLNKKIALIASFLLATSALHTHYSWVARPHAITTLCILASLFLLHGILRAVARNSEIPHGILLAYTLINAGGSANSYAYTLFLGASLIAVLVFVHIHSRTGYLRRHAKRIVPVVLIHTLFPLMQSIYLYPYAHGVLRSALWIPPYSISNVIGTLFTVTNSSGYITGELYASPYSITYASLVVLLLFFAVCIRYLHKHSRLISYLYITGLFVHVAGAGVLYSAFDMTITQPRLMFFFHILFLIGLSVVIADTLSPKRLRVHGYTLFTAIVLSLYFLSMNIYSFPRLNLSPYYNNPKDIERIKEIRVLHVPVYVFPPGEVLTVNYIWGLTGPIDKKLIPTKALFLVPDDLSTEPGFIPSSAYAVIHYTEHKLTKTVQNYLTVLSYGCQKEQLTYTTIYFCNE